MATGARYCIHCGAEQSVPTPIAAVAAAAMARGGVREAANAAHADPAHIASTARARADPVDVASASHGPDPAPRAANSDQPTRPVYADAPRRRGLAALIVAGLAVVAIAVAAGIVWRVTGEPPPIARAAAPAQAPASTASAGSAPASSATPTAGTASTPTPTSDVASSPTAGAASTPEAAAPPSLPEPALSPQPATSTADANRPVEIKPLPPHPATASRPAHRAQATKPPPTGAAQAAEPAAAAPSPAQTPAPTVAQLPAPAHRAAASHVDRWQRLDAELSQCTREDFIARVICGQRVRFRYCDGYWGRVPQCPGSPSGNDRGQ